VTRYDRRRYRQYKSSSLDHSVTILTPSSAGHEAAAAADDDDDDDGGGGGGEELSADDVIQLMMT